jgi:transposase
MVFRKIDNGSKKIAAKLYLRGRDTVPEITDLCDLSSSTLRRYVSLYEATGDVVKPKSYLQGRPRSLTREDVEYIQELTRAQPTLYLREIRDALLDNRLIDFDISTIHNTLEREHISYKKLHSTASERDAVMRADFQIRMADYHTPQLVFCDETASDERTYFRLYGRAPVNQRAISAAPFIRGDRYSLLPAMGIDGIFAADIVKGSYSRDRFVRFLEEDMVCSFL